MPQIKILEIPKNASRFASTLSRGIVTAFIPEKEDIDVVFVRDVYERFWSACKTVIPEISFFGDYPPKGDPKRTTYEGMNIDVAVEIGKGIALLSASPLDVHFAPQVSFIQGKKFDEVLQISPSFQVEVQELSEKYGLLLPENYSFDVINDSPKDLDAQALAYIANTPEVKSAIDAFYSQDIAMFSNLESLKK